MISSLGAIIKVYTYRWTISLYPLILCTYEYIVRVLGWCLLFLLYTKFTFVALGYLLPLPSLSLIIPVLLIRGTMNSKVSVSRYLYMGLASVLFLSFFLIVSAC